MRGSELAPQAADHARRIDPKQAQQNPRIHRDQRHKRTAEVQAQNEFDQNQANRAQDALAKRIAQHDAGMRGVEFFVNIEPVADGDPTQRRKHKQQCGHRKIDVKSLVQMQPHARLVRGYEGDGSKQNVSGPENGLDFSIVPAKHFGLSIT